MTYLDKGPCGPMILRRTLDAFKESEIREVPLALVKTHNALQPRSDSLVPYKHKARSENLSDEHCQSLRVVLDSGADIHLEAIWLAEIPATPEQSLAAGLFIVDGHHRFRAYQRARRSTILARIVPLDFESAVIASKPVNCTGCKLAMHQEQRLDAAWQYLAFVMERGARPLLPNGESLRTIAARFGVGHSTVSRMLLELSNVNLAEFRKEACDPGTGWPRWKYIRTPKAFWQTPLEVLPEEARVAKEAEDLARKIVELMEHSTPMARALALKLLADEAIPSPDPVETVNFLAEASRPYGTHLEYVLSHWTSKQASRASEMSQNNCPIGTAP